MEVSQLVESYTLQPPRYYRAKLRREMSNRLFRACWDQYRRFLQGSIDDPDDDQTVLDWLQQIAAEKVNNYKSSFYIHG